MAAEAACPFCGNDLGAPRSRAAAYVGAAVVAVASIAVTATTVGCVSTRRAATRAFATGLRYVVWEQEAALDGIPSIVVDPKGDLASLLLAFPDGSAASFAPWVPPNTSKGRS